jgi:AraC-like DNA-binding protein
LEQQGWISGPSTAPFTRTLRGQGRVLGIKFRPGGFRDWSGESVHQLRDQRLPASSVLPALDQTILEVWQQASSVQQCSVSLQSVLADQRPILSPETTEVHQWMDWIQNDLALSRVEELAQRAGLGTRSIQRRLKEWVGVSPKWVLSRVRMLRAVEAIKAREFIDLSELAYTMGYADLAHFSRDFKSSVGVAPSAFLSQRSDSPQTQA